MAQCQFNLIIITKPFHEKEKQWGKNTNMENLASVRHVYIMAEKIKCKTLRDIYFLEITNYTVRKLPTPRINPNIFQTMWFFIGVNWFNDTVYGLVEGNTSSGVH